jgi:uncharacterized protein (TIGR02266 family)
MAEETRKDQRVKAQTLRARYKSTTVDEFIEQYSKDISRSGMFIKTPKPPALGALLKIEIQLKDGTPVLGAVGRVVQRREEPEARPDAPAGMGIRFLKVEDASLAVIDGIMARKGEGAGPHFESLRAPSMIVPTGPSIRPQTEARADFFGAAGATPAQQPNLEDQTQMRQMSALLGEALRLTKEAPATPTAAAPAVLGAPTSPGEDLGGFKSTIVGFGKDVARPVAAVTPVAAEVPEAPAAPMDPMAMKATLVGMAPAAMAHVAPVTAIRRDEPVAATPLETPAPSRVDDVIARVTASAPPPATESPAAQEVPSIAPAAPEPEPIAVVAKEPEPEPRRRRREGARARARRRRREGARARARRRREGARARARRRREGARARARRRREGARARRRRREARRDARREARRDARREARRDEARRDAGGEARRDARGEARGGGQARGSGEARRGAEGQHVDDRGGGPRGARGGGVLPVPARGRAAARGPRAAAAVAA